MIYNENCCDTLKRNLKYDYVLTSPPDFKEINLDPTKKSYDIFLRAWMPLLEPKNKIITICITDRKTDNRIYSKHINCIRIMEENNWTLASHKIWIKSFEVNKHKLNYMHIMTFTKKPIITDSYPDVMIDPTINEKQTAPRSYHYKGFRFSMSLEVCKTLILNHTKLSDTVYDPFMGSGTTAIASILTNRKYSGSEISREYTNLAKERIAEYT